MESVKKSDKDTYLEFWGYELGTPEAEEAWEAKQKMMRTPADANGNYHIMGDQYYDGMQGPGGVDISTRAKHREYMKRTGLVTFDDYQDTFAKEQARRDAYHSGERGSVGRKDIERAIAQLTGQC